MNRKSLLFCLLILILGISLLAGCGGGGKDDDKTVIKKGPSSDYIGLEVGAVITYNAIINGVDRGNFSEKVLTKVEGHHGIFKTGFIAPGKTEPDSGDYIGIDGNTYYARGEWDNTEEEPYDEILPGNDGIYMINPITDGFVSDIYGDYLGKETITTPIGKFEAYKFHAHDEGIDEEGTDEEVRWTDDDYIWFVPYLGTVKSYYEEKENGEFISKDNITIVAYSFAAGSRGTSSSYLSAQNSSALNPEVAAKLRRILKK